MKKTTMTIIAIAAVAAMTACQSSKETNKAENTEATVTETMTEQPVAMAMPRVVIYKTTADFSNFVPFAMDDSKTQIVSFPDPADIKDNKRPTQLDNGYLLDNFGIGKNVVYTDYTYEQYAALESVPDLETLMQHIVERNPLVEYYVSGAEYPRTGEARTIEGLNKVIANAMNGFEKVEL
ncbi:MAG: hypothetical protein IKA91_06755 [Bacteroidaceae bacterium]|nr:hypothetical protein [Bacteroidaceae bacterium]